METIKDDNDLNLNCYDSCSDSYYSEHEENDNNRKSSEINEDLDKELFFKHENESHSNTSVLNNIICIQMLNNNKIFLNYDPNWTLRDVSRINYLATLFNYESQRIS
jgi:hypothetical protein